MLNSVQTIEVPGVHFSMQDHLMIIEVENAFAKAKLTTRGACVLSYQPQGEEEIIWVSDQSVYDGSRPVRGGIPVCWPWFGQHPTDSDMPAHGFVRNRVWRLESVLALNSGATEIIFSCEHNEDSLALWPYQFHLELRVVVGEKLSMTLVTSNLSAYDVSITEALHTYFKVADVNGMAVEGLEGATHLDKLGAAVPPETQQTGVVVHPPMDSVYLDQEGTVRIKDKGRDLVIEKANSTSAVVWNPGPSGAKAFSDMADDAWPEMLCVEAGNVLENSVSVASGQKHQFSMSLSVEKTSEV